MHEKFIVIFIVQAEIINSYVVFNSRQRRKKRENFESDKSN